MTTYVKIEPSEEIAIKRAVLEARASNIRMQDNLAKTIKLKKNKKTAMRGLSTTIKKINQEVLKIKEVLPSYEKSGKTRLSKKETEKYHLELKAIKEKISRLV